jgi:hypothetical protein
MSRFARRNFLSSLMLGAALFGAAMIATDADAALVNNGSFELGSFVGDMNDTMSLAPPSTAMTGWTVTNGTLAWIGPTNTFSLAAQDGGYFLDLTGYHDNVPYGGVTQSIATNVGSQYALTFYLGSSSQYGIPDSIIAAAGSTSRIFTSTNLTANSTWEFETLVFTATGSSTNISLVGNSGDKYIGLDDVAVAAVPEPATWAMMILGFMGIGAMTYRRRKQPAALHVA